MTFLNIVPSQGCIWRSGSNIPVRASLLRLKYMASQGETVIA